MAAQARRADHDGGPTADVFDQGHLAHYTMHDARLEREIINLFLMQLPATIDAIAEARSQAEWKLATHTLKGSAASIGARRLQSIAADLEHLPGFADPALRGLRVQSLRAAEAEFRGVIRHIYP